MQHRSGRLCLQRRAIAVSIAALSSSAFPAQADSHTPPVELREVVVTATRTERKVDEVPASVSVITGEALSNQHNAKVEDALRNLEGIDFNTSPSSPGAAVPMIRGIGVPFSGTTSSVLVDGMATDSYISSVVGRGGFNFLAEQDIERIEVVRGPASALYGPNVVGGVVNMIQKRWRGDAGAELYAEAGSHQSRGQGVVAGTAGDKLDVRLSSYEFETDGFVAAPGIDTGPRGWQERKWNLNGGLRPSDDQEISFAVQHFESDQSYVGGSTFQNRQRLEGDAYILGYRKDFSGDASLKLKYRHSTLLQSWVDDPDGMGVGTRTSISDTLDTQVDLHPLPGNTLSLGATWQSADFETVDFSDHSRTTSSARSTGVFIQDEHRFGKLVATVGGRYDRIRQDASITDGTARPQGSTENTFNPRLGLRYHLSPATSIYTSVGTAFVAANGDLKYLNSPASWKDNPDLKPESSITYEIGANHTLAWGAFRGAIYHTDYTDMISTIPVGAATWPRQFVNIGKVAVDGLELGFEGRLPGGWRPYANYSYTRSIIKENPSSPDTVGKHVQRIAPHKFNLGVSYAPGDDWSLNLAGRYVGGRYFTDFNTDAHRAGGYFVSDVRLNLRLPASPSAGRWDAYLAVNNLFDRQYTVWENEYADGRNVWLGVSARF